jgi:hypothetical protein
MSKHRLSIRHVWISSPLFMILSAAQICSGANKCDLTSLSRNQKHRPVLRRLAWFAEWKIGPFRTSSEAVFLTGLNHTGHCSKELKECKVYESVTEGLDLSIANVSMVIVDGVVSSVSLDNRGGFRQGAGPKQASQEMTIRDGHKVKVIKDPFADDPKLMSKEGEPLGSEAYEQCVLEIATLEIESSKGGLLDDSAANENWPSIQNLDASVRDSNLLLRGGKVLIARHKSFDPAIFVVLIRPRESSKVFLLWKRALEALTIMPIGSFDARLDERRLSQLVSSRSIKIVEAQKKK